MLDDLSMMLSWMNLSIDLKSWTPIHARGSNFDIFMPCKKVYASSWTTPTVYDDKKKSSFISHMLIKMQGCNVEDNFEHCM